MEKNILISVLYIAIILYASYIDLRYQIVKNYIHILIILLSLTSNTGNIQTLIEAVIITIPVLFYATWSNHMGGGDVKFIFSNTIWLGFWGMYVAIILGSLLLIIRYILNKVNKNSNVNKTFPLIPYLSFGCFISYVISFYAKFS